MNGEVNIVILKSLKKQLSQYKKKYYNQKLFKGLNFKEGNKVYLLTKIFKNK